MNLVLMFYGLGLIDIDAASSSRGRIFFLYVKPEVLSERPPSRIPVFLSPGRLAWPMYASCFTADWTLPRVSPLILLLLLLILLLQDFWRIAGLHTLYYALHTLYIR